MKSTTKIIIIISGLFVCISLYLRINSGIKQAYTPTYDIEDFYTIPDRQRLVNEYKNVTVSDKEMAKKYFNVFWSSVFENKEKSYDLLETDYKETNYPTYGNYLAYLKAITKDFSYYPKMSQYKKEVKDGTPMYIIIDENNNKYVFLIEAVMKYKIKFSE